MVAMAGKKDRKPKNAVAAHRGEVSGVKNTFAVSRMICFKRAGNDGFAEAVLAIMGHRNDQGRRLAAAPTIGQTLAPPVFCPFSAKVSLASPYTSLALAVTP